MKFRDFLPVLLGVITGLVVQHVLFGIPDLETKPVATSICTTTNNNTNNNITAAAIISDATNIAITPKIVELPPPMAEGRCINYRIGMYEVTFKGHEYLTVNNFLYHAESCPCKQLPEK